ncbi:hypothetical protein MuYL_0235 [Mucilaginibacter xinganensis]|uniref:Uncharacterized protein n=1 Tax=Mucilaginibacter xinganensis TaxID=1234841 RepID=A0A223NR50_9SPHI|nr:hypothetical protein MuYL_0235 [Mucilaginibacter xinganensis]
MYWLLKRNFKTKRINKSDPNYIRYFIIYCTAFYGDAF